MPNHGPSPNCCRRRPGPASWFDEQSDPTSHVLRPHWPSYFAGDSSSAGDSGASIRRGARGESKVETFVQTQPVGFGPFTLPAGQRVFAHKQPDPSAGRVANVGNALFAELKIKILLDYRERLMAFYGDCS
jgi:hypothetical protein